MKKKEYAELFEKLEIRPRSQEAADMLGICLRSAYHYADGDREIPIPIGRLLRLIVVCKAKGLHTEKLVGPGS